MYPHIWDPLVRTTTASAVLKKITDRNRIVNCTIKLNNRRLTEGEMRRHFIMTIDPGVVFNDRSVR
jgi:hypothetical protein